MNQRLVWNFEFDTKKNSFLTKYPEAKEIESLKWEIRFFWPDDVIIVLNPIDDSLLNLESYKQKHRKDYYYLLAENNYNLKKRGQDVLYKPLLHQVDQARGFGAKINIEYRGDLPEKTTLNEPYLQQIAQRIAQQSSEIPVKKYAFLYKFPTIPTVKLELARLEVANQIYFSVCIEGKSLKLVKNIAGNLVGKQASGDYVLFLKNILQL